MLLLDYSMLQPKSQFILLTSHPAQYSPKTNLIILGSGLDDREIVVRFPADVRDSAVLKQSDRHWGPPSSLFRQYCELLPADKAAWT
jgi:hypothetical protein